MVLEKQGSDSQEVARATEEQETDKETKAQRG